MCGYVVIYAWLCGYICVNVLLYVWLCGYACGYMVKYKFRVNIINLFIFDYSHVPDIYVYFSFFVSTPSL